MSTLSIFVDESGDYGPYAPHAPWYIVSLVFHDQSVDISRQIADIRRHVAEAQFPANHAIHTAPLIRREGTYAFMDSVPARRKLFRCIFTFARHTHVTHAMFAYDKRQLPTRELLVARMLRDMQLFVRDNLERFLAFDRVVIYYDGGQREITSLIKSVFVDELHAEIRHVRPSDYSLFQVADLFCTLELLRLKYDSKALTKSELAFFGGARRLYANYLRPMNQWRF